MSFGPPPGEGSVPWIPYPTVQPSAFLAQIARSMQAPVRPAQPYIPNPNLRASLVAAGSPFHAVAQMKEFALTKSVVPVVDAREIGPVVRVLGKGTFGLVTAREFRGQLVAVKQLLSKKRDEIASILEETYLMKRCEHPNVAKCIALTVDHTDGCVYMLSPIYPHGSLADLFENGPRHADVDVKAFVVAVLGAARGVEHMHSLGITHGDMHGGNILIAADYSSVVTDFGCAIDTSSWDDSEQFLQTDTANFANFLNQSTSFIRKSVYIANGPNRAHQLAVCQELLDLAEMTEDTDDNPNPNMHQVVEGLTRIYNQYY